jgi:hypothetical protein
VCGKEIPECEYWAYGGELCESCTATRYKRYKAPGCFAISDMLKAPPSRRGASPSDSDDLDSEAWDKQFDEREAERKAERKPEPISKRKQQLYDKHHVAANNK